MQRGADVGGWLRAGRGRWGGFSLVELLITVALIIVLMVLLYGGNGRSRQQKKLRLCQQNLEVIYTAIQLYSREHAGKLPTVENSPAFSDEPLSLLVPQYTSLTAPFICPGSRDAKLPEGAPFRGRRISYSYYMGGPLGGAQAPLLTDWQVNTRAKAQNEPLFSPDGKSPGNNHEQYGGNILFEDGHILTSPAQASVPLVPPTGVVLLNPRP